MNSAKGVKPGPIFYEAARFEERLGEQRRAVNFILAGIEKSPRYGTAHKTSAMFVRKTCC